MGTIQTDENPNANDKRPDRLKLLYKFIPWKYPFNKILTHRVLWFQCPLEFNDPFDCAIRPRYDLMSPKDKYLNALRVVQMKHPNLPLRIQKERARSGFVAMSTQKGYREAIERMQKATLLKTGVCSFAGNRDRILLWGHYADKHAGIAVGFDSTLLRDSFFERNKPGRRIFLSQVQYEDYYPNLIPPLGPDEVEAILTTKAMDWQYEDEHRFILYENTRLEVEFPSDAVREIILGCRISDQHKRKVCEIGRMDFAHADILQAQPKADEFALNFLSIEKA